LEVFSFHTTPLTTNLFPRLLTNSFSGRFKHVVAFADTEFSALRTSNQIHRIFYLQGGDGKPSKVRAL